MRIVCSPVGLELELGLGCLEQEPWKWPACVKTSFSLDYIVCVVFQRARN